MEEKEYDEHKGRTVLLAILQVLLLCIAVIYFATFLMALFGMPAHVAIIATIVDTVVAITPQIIPVIPFSITGGEIHILFFIIFVVALLLDWPCARTNRKTRIANKAAALERDMGTSLADAETEEDGQ